MICEKHLEYFTGAEQIEKIKQAIKEKDLHGIKQCEFCRKEVPENQLRKIAYGKNVNFIICAEWLS